MKTGFSRISKKYSMSYEDCNGTDNEGQTSQETRTSSGQREVVAPRTGTSEVTVNYRQKR